MWCKVVFHGRSSSPSDFLLLAMANQMKNQSPQGGSIIAISSIWALVGGECKGIVQTSSFVDICCQRYPSHYTPTKAGVLSLTKSCAVALGKYNIRSNAVFPGTIATDINKQDPADPQKREYMINRTGSAVSSGSHTDQYDFS
jgi:L-rhamnose 1-dehydrogenase